VDSKAGEERWRVGLNYAWVESRMRFDDDFNADLRQHALVATVGYAVLENTTVQLSLGILADGELETDLPTFDLEPGFLTSVSISHDWLGGSNAFLVTSFSGAVSTTNTRGPLGDEARLTAVDFRGTVIGGYTFADRVSPYLLVQGFGGPVFWEVNGEDITGSDRNHYAVGAGVSVRIGEFALSVSGSAVGERSISAGVSMAF
jgi:hypothetical protein